MKLTNLPLEGEAYPEGVDCFWIACDSSNQLAAFITAGSGPIPEKLLVHQLINIEDVEDRIVGLLEGSDANLLTSVPRPDDFLALARRGFHVFDWTDVHRTIQQSIGAYELVAKPGTPRMIDTLPDDLRLLAGSIRFQSLNFSDCEHIDPTRHTVCRSAPDHCI